MFVFTANVESLIEFCCSVNLCLRKKMNFCFYLVCEVNVAYERFSVSSVYLFQFSLELSFHVFFCSKVSHFELPMWWIR